MQFVVASEEKEFKKQVCFRRVHDVIKSISDQ